MIQAWSIVVSHHQISMFVPAVNKILDQSLSKPIMGLVKEKLLSPWTWNCENVYLRLFNLACHLAFMSRKSISENESTSQRQIEIRFGFNDVDLVSWSSHAWRWKPLHFSFTCAYKFSLSFLSLLLFLAISCPFYYISLYWISHYFLKSIYHMSKHS